MRFFLGLNGGLRDWAVGGTRAPSPWYGPNPVYTRFRFRRKVVLHEIMTACIVMHNMIIEDKRDLDAPIEDVMEASTPEVQMVVDENTRFQQFLTRHRQIKHKDAQIALRNALIEHLWEEYTNSDN